MQVKKKPPELCMWYEPYLDGAVIVFQDVDKYLSIRNRFDVGNDRLFLCNTEIAFQATACQAYFFMFGKIDKSVCQHNGVSGFGTKKSVESHWGLEKLNCN